MTSGQLLEEIGLVWNSSRADYRDARIKIGQMIQEYVVTRLREGDDLSEDERRTLGISRFAALKSVAQFLGILVRQVNDLIRTAMAVDLLSYNGYLSEMTYTALRMFRLLIERTPGELRRNKINGEAESSHIRLSERELWRTRPEAGQRARDLFLTAVRNRWTSGKVWTEVQNLVSISQCRKNRGPLMKSTRDEDRKLNLQELARNSTAKDLANLIIELIGMSSEPEEVAAIVRHAQLRRKYDWSEVKS